MIVGIIGAGYIAGVQIKQLLRLAPHVKIKWLIDPELHQAKELARIHGIPFTSQQYEDAIFDEEVDVIHNCTPNHFHFAVNKLALEQGKHVFSEKPLAMTAEEGWQLVDLAKEKGKEAGVNFCYRYYPALLEAKHQLKEKTLGKINLVRGHYLQDWLLYRNDFNWRLLPENSGCSSVLSDIGCHWFDLIQTLTGEKIVKVMADLGVFHEERLYNNNIIPCHLEDAGNVLFRLENGAMGQLCTTQMCAGKKCEIGIEIMTETVSLSWNHERQAELKIGTRDKGINILLDPPLRKARNNWPQPPQLPSGHPIGYHDIIYHLFCDFYAAMETPTETPQYPTFEEGAYQLSLVEAAIRSSQEGCWQNILTPSLLPA